MIFLLAILGFIGLAVGSFITVVVARLGKNETIVRGRSHCVHCKKTLHWFELMPALSFILQSGHCRSCKKPIPKSYFAIELITAALFSAFGWAIFRGIIQIPRFLSSAAGESALGLNWPDFTITFAYYAFFIAAAVAISFYDIGHRLVPYALILPLILIGSAGKIIGAVRTGDINFMLLALGIAAASFLFFWSVWFFSKGRAMGRGDADAALAIALYLNPAASILGLIFSFWIGAVVGIMLIASGKLGWKSQIPFTPFLFLGSLAAIFVSNGIFMLNFIPYGF